MLRGPACQFRSRSVKTQDRRCMSFTLEAAREIDVPCALFWTASVCGYMGYRYYRDLMEKGIFPLKG